MSIAQDDAQSNGRPLLEVGRHRILAEAQAVAAMVNAMDDHFLAALHLIDLAKAKYWSVELEPRQQWPVGWHICWR